MESSIDIEVQLKDASPSCLVQSAGRGFHATSAGRTREAQWCRHHATVSLDDADIERPISNRKENRVEHTVSSPSETVPTNLRIETPEDAIM